jgi:hypothetical protein
VCARARAPLVFVLSVFGFGRFFFFVFRFFSLKNSSETEFNPSSLLLLFLNKQAEARRDKEDKEDKEENDDEDIIIIEAAAVALQKVLDEIVFSCHRRVDSFDVLGCAELRATTRTKTKSDDNDEGGE